MKKQDFLKRNLPVFIVGFITLIVFIIIIAASQKKSGDAPRMAAVDETDLIAAHTYVVGNPEAKLTIVEFTDLACTECAEYHKTLMDHLDLNRKYMKIALRHFPSEDRENSTMASVAAQVSGEQNKFWDFVGTAFLSGKESFTKGDLTGFAQSLGMDTQKFVNDLENQNFRSIIKDDVRDGERIGVKKAPTIFVNGIIVQINNVDDLRRILRTELEKLNLSGTSGGTSSYYRDSQPGPAEGYYGTEAYPIEDVHIEQEYIKQSKETLQIKYTQDGWNPKSTSGFAGQKVVWTNTTDKTIYLEQLDKKFTEFTDPREIAPGGTLEFTLYKDRVWRYQEKTTKHWGAIFINTLD